MNIMWSKASPNSALDDVRRYGLKEGVFVVRLIAESNYFFPKCRDGSGTHQSNFAVDNKGIIARK